MASPLKDVGEQQWCCLFCCSPVSKDMVTGIMLNFTVSCIDYGAFTVTLGGFKLALRTTLEAVA